MKCSCHIFSMNLSCKLYLCIFLDILYHHVIIDFITYDLLYKSEMPSNKNLNTLLFFQVVEIQTWNFRALLEMNVYLYMTRVMGFLSVKMAAMKRIVQVFHVSNKLVYYLAKLSFHFRVFVKIIIITSSLFHSVSEILIQLLPCLM